MKALSVILTLALGAFGGSASRRSRPAYPSKPIRLVIGFAPGGAADYVARAMSDAFGKALGPAGGRRQQAGQRLEHRGRSRGQVAAGRLHAADRQPQQHLGQPGAQSQRWATRPSDLTAVTKMTTSPLVLAVNPATGIRSVADLIAAAKKDPGQAQLLDLGQWLGAAPRRRAVRPADRRADDAHSVPRRRAGDPVGDGGRHAADLRHVAVGAAAGRRREDCSRSRSAPASARSWCRTCPA